MKFTRYSVVVAAIVATVAFAGCGKKAAQTTVASSPTAAQAPGGGGFGAMAQFREAHKYTFLLTRMVSNIGKLDTETEAPLTQAQAKGILAVLEPLQKQPKMTQDEAKATAGKLKMLLTEKQLTEMGKMKQPQRPQGQGQRMQGQGGGQGQARRPSFDPIAMKDFNPFNPSGNSSMAQRSAKRMADFLSALKAKAAGSTAPAATKTSDPGKA
jgi:hypothetical protein